MQQHISNADLREIMTSHRPFSWIEKPSGKCCRENQNIFYMQYFSPLKLVPCVRAKKPKLTA